MALARWCFADPLAGLVLIRVLLVAASLPIVWCAARWGERFYGRQGFWVAGGLAACWPDLWVMAPHALGEVMAADALVPAFYLASAEAKSRRDVAVAGFLLGFCVVARLQVAPAVAVAGVALCGRQAWRWGVAVAAGAVPVAAAGVLDWMAWRQPFRSFWLNVDLNLWHNVASGFGAEPAGFYVALLALDWRWSLLGVAGLVWLGARRLPAAGLAVAVIVLTHSLIPHKELRFIFPAVALAVPVAGVGLARVVQRVTARGWLKLAAAWVALAGPLASPFLYYQLMHQTNSFALFETLKARKPALIAVGPWIESFLPLDVVFDSSVRLTDFAGVFRQAAPRPDFIVATEGSIVVPGGYRLEFCHSGHWDPYGGTFGPRFCVWAAVGAHSTAGPAPPVGVGDAVQARAFVVRDRLSGWRP